MEDLLSTDVLDLLVDGPSHVGGLYATLTKHVRAVPIADFTDTIRALEHHGLVRLWLHLAGESMTVQPQEREYAFERYEAELVGIDLNSLYHDEIGLWCEITSQGRKRWEEAGYEVELDGVRWTLDEKEEAAARGLTIHAETKSAAERVLSWWLDRQVEGGQATDVVIKPLPSFKLRDGRTIEGGVELTCTVEGKGEYLA